MSLSLTAIALTPPIIYAIGNIFSKKSTDQSGGFYSSVLMMGVGIIPVALFAALSPIELNSTLLLFGAASGILLGVGTALFFMSMDNAQVSNVAVFILLQQIITVLFSIYGLGESFGVVDIVGSIVIVLGIVLVSVTSDFKFNKFLLPSLIANILWTLTWILTSYAISIGQNSNDLLLVGRIAGTLVILAAYLLIRNKNANPMKMPRRNIYAIIAGLLNGVGTIVYADLVNLGIFALGGILASLNPAITAGLACLIYKERLSRRQWFGLLVATAGTFIVAAQG